MEQDIELKSKCGQNTGLRVPEGYFDRLNEAIMAQLPPKTEIREAPRMTTWQRFKPYVYLAAMFAGIWLMMSIFHRVSNMSLNIENVPENIASAMSMQPDYDDFDSYESDYAIEQEVSANYVSFDEFQKDFGYDFKPEYANLIFR